MKQVFYRLRSFSLYKRVKIVILMLFISTYLSAHPHTFIDVYPTFFIEDNATTLIKFEWVLDDMSSTMLIMDLDINANGIIDTSENAYIEKEYFSSLDEYEYYTYITVANKKIQFPQPNNFQATIHNNKLSYSFEITVNAKLQDIAIEFGDSSSFVAMILKRKFVQVKGLKIEDLNVEITDVDAESYYGYKLEIK